MTQARAVGCYKLTLSSNLRRTEAHAFYDALGFERHVYSFLIPLEPVPPAPEQQNPNSPA